jgi:hypothetical protein
MWDPMRKNPSARLLLPAAALFLALLILGLGASAALRLAAPTATPPPTPTFSPTAAPSRTPTPPPSATPTAPPTATTAATATAPVATATESPAGSATPAATETPLPVETPDPGAWLTRSTAHYDLYYLPDSPAAHDIDHIAQLAEQAMTTAAARLEAPPNTRIRIYFVNRIFWQGGAAYSGNQLLLSYPPPGRDYTSTSLLLVLTHETTHALVGQLLGNNDPKGGLLGEGVAVWAAGGHYQTENLEALASTLITDNASLYLPLADLRRDFYDAQHELAYLEGAAYTQYLIDRWGLAKFKVYLSQPDDPRPVYGMSSDDLEAAWRAHLATVPHTASDSEAVRLRVRYYDLMRRYETTLDHDARILPGQPPGAWGPTLIRIFSAPASAPADVAIEQDFVQAGTALWGRDLQRCGALLDSIAARLPQ